MARNQRMFAVLDDRETEIEVEIQVHSWGRAAQTYGPAEGCYPAEDPELEIVSAWMLEDAVPRPDILPSLTAAEIERITTEFLEQDHG